MKMNDNDDDDDDDDHVCDFNICCHQSIFMGITSHIHNNV